MWGAATPGAAVTIVVAGGGGDEHQTVTAAANGTWQVDLRVRPATVAPSNITVTSVGQTATLRSGVGGLLPGVSFFGGIHYYYYFRAESRSFQADSESIWGSRK